MALRQPAMYKYLFSIQNTSLNSVKHLAYFIFCSEIIFLEIAVTKVQKLRLADDEKAGLIYSVAKENILFFTAQTISYFFRCSCLKSCMIIFTLGNSMWFSKVTD